MNLFGETAQQFFVTTDDVEWAVFIERKDENELFEWMKLVGIPDYPKGKYYTKPPQGKDIIALDKFLEVWNEHAD